jgi:hypothetical protein
MAFAYLEFENENMHHVQLRTIRLQHQSIVQTQDIPYVSRSRKWYFNFGCSTLNQKLIQELNRIVLLTPFTPTTWHQGTQSSEGGCGSTFPLPT